MSMMLPVPPPPLLEEEREKLIEEASAQVLKAWLGLNAETCVLAVRQAIKERRREVFFPTQVFQDMSRDVFPNLTLPYPITADHLWTALEGWFGDQGYVIELDSCIQVKGGDLRNVHGFWVRW